MGWGEVVRCFQSPRNQPALRIQAISWSMRKVESCSHYQKYAAKQQMSVTTFNIKTNVDKLTEKLYIISVVYIKEKLSFLHFLWKSYNIFLA